MSERFDTAEFLDWLEDVDGAVRLDVLNEEWPSFPTHDLVGITYQIDDDGNSLVPKRDLIDVARGRRPLD